MMENSKTEKAWINDFPGNSSVALAVLNGKAAHPSLATSCLSIYYPLPPLFFSISIFSTLFSLFLTD